MMHPYAQFEMLRASSARKALSGFLVSGSLVSFLGAILPAWGYHLRLEYSTIGNYFLAMSVGMLASVRPGRYMLRRWASSTVLVLACSLGFLSIVALAFTDPTLSNWWRIFGLFSIGAAAGLLNAAIFQSISPAYRQNPAATVNLGGSYFGLGCVLVSLLIAGAFETYNVGSILFLVALIPGFFAIMYAKTRFRADIMPSPRFDQIAREFRNPFAILMSLLLFFQFGNEWAIAGWLALFLIQRLGVSPQTALLIVALYWTALLLGRMLVQWLLPTFSHWKMLLASVIAAMLGCIVLASTNNVFGACTGVLCVGFGFAAIYPLMVEKIGARFPSYHPGFFNGIFSIALTGGMLAPWMLGYYAEIWGIQIVMLLPMLGTCAVFLLLAMIWGAGKLEQHQSAQLQNHGL